MLPEHLDDRLAGGVQRAGPGQGGTERVPQRGQPVVDGPGAAFHQPVGVQREGSPRGTLNRAARKDPVPSPSGSPVGRSSTCVAPPGRTSTGGRWPAWAMSQVPADGSMTA